MTAGASNQTQHAERILIVEDDPQIREVIAWTLEDEGLAVATASTGRQALDLAAAQRPSLVILDIGLPDIDGYAVANGVREAQDDGIPFLVITADGRAQEKAGRVGAYGYLSKPFELDALIAAVWRGLGG